MARIIIENEDILAAAVHLRRCARVIRLQISKRGDTRDKDGEAYCVELDDTALKLETAKPPTQLEEAMKDYNPPAVKQLA